MTDPDDLIELLSLRHDVLRSLLDEPRERHALVDDLEASKSTVYKGVSQLQEHGLVASTADGLRPTLFGVVALERYDEMARAATLGDLLADLPPGTVEPAALVGAETVVPDPRSVDRHLARVERILRHADTLRGFSPAVSPRTVETFHERVVEDGFEAEIVLTEEIVGYLRRDHESVLHEVLDAASVALYRTDEALPFTLLLAGSAEGTEVCIDMGNAGLVTGLVINDTAESRRWAETAHRERKQNAEPITADVLRSE